ncbi:Protein SMAX1-LIKE 3 [Hirschfeldia incana]|nr:Protein SMAX1-LIKE 3 [Hirschfeldia incana]
MRAGGCTVEQALTPEAANVVKQSMGLARRRGHAQVTPLHVASTMLSAPTGILRTACLQSHTHPLQCRALELCFNVALNRLPTSTGSPMLGIQTSPFPSISNALGAAFKRAQAHQRRGTIESQQQQILAVKIEVEQLIISILDDPSVSRVMREAGFSSPQVKSKVEQAVSLESSSKTISTSKPKEGHELLTPVRDEDVMNVIDNLVDKRKRNFVIVGECLATVDKVVRTVMEKVDKKDVPETLKDVKFITLSFASFGQPSRSDVEHKLKELETLVRSCVGKGVILNLGDLNWFVESRTKSSLMCNNNNDNNYCAVEHMIVEIGKLARGLLMGDHGRFWLMGLATSQTYVRCKSGQPSLESLWCLTSLTIPMTSSSLRLSLVSEREFEVKKSESLPLRLSSSADQLSFCEECSVKFEEEARFLRCRNDNSNVNTAVLPAWLQQYKKENQNSLNDSDSMKELVVKWNTICHAIHNRPSLKTLTLSSRSGSTQPSSTLHQTNGDSITPDSFPLRVFLPELLSSNPNSTVNSEGSSSEGMEVEHASSRFKEMNAENLAVLCDALHSKVPSQKDIISEIAKIVLKCRSGSSTRTINGDKDVKEDTWMFFQGLDVEAKEKIARELAKVVFGSQDRFVSICLSSFSSKDLRNKRSRDEQSWSYIERFSEAVWSDPNRVFLVEDIEQADYLSQKGFKRAIERGRVRSLSGEEASLRDAIVIFSCERFSSRSRACSPPVNEKSDGSDQSEDKNVVSCVALDLNLSLDDDACEEESCDEISLLESVDAQFDFKCSST